MRMNRFVAYAVGLILLSFGVVLAVKANYGVTVATSPSYVLSLGIPSISFGTFNYLTQGAVFVLTLASLRTFQVKYLLSFASSVIFGYAIDFFAFLMRPVVLNGHPIRALAFTASILIISGGLVFFYRSNLPILPFDVFVREVSEKYGIEVGSFKLGFDLAMLASAVAISLLFFGRLKGVAMGTLISAVTIGPVLGRMMRLFDRHIMITSIEDKPS